MRSVRQIACGTDCQSVARADANVSPPRSGKILVLFAVLLPALLALIGLVLDGGALLGASRRAQHAADAAATAAARNLQRGLTTLQATTSAEDFVQEYNELSTADVTVNIPPTSGPYSGNAKFVEVEVVNPVETHFLPFLGGATAPAVETRAVAGVKASTAAAAVVVLDPDPPPFTMGAITGIIPALPALVGGLEVLGTSGVRVDGAVLVNTQWGGVDEYGDPTGAEAPPPSAIACLNLLANPRLRARDIRVVGGVDNQSYYAHYVSGNPSPLAAGRLAVPDPARTLPVPTTAADAAVVNINRGSVLIADLPGAPWRTLNPGVYEWIELVSGRVYFNPGVYIVRGTNPVTGIGLNIIAAQIDAQNVMFYLTNTTTYSPLTGLPDASDGETAPPAPGVGNLTPSAVINLSVAGSELWGRSYAGSSLGWITVFQRRADRRPIVILTTDTYDGDDLRGVVYAKWGHVVLTGQGLTLGRFAAGTMRILTTGTFSITPATWLPPAEDVYLVE